MLSVELDERLRRLARRLGVSVATLCHVAFGQVVARARPRADGAGGAAAPGRAVCDLMVRSLEQLAEALERAPATPARRLDVLPPAERRLLLETWNQTAAAYRREACVHQLFEEQVRR